MAGDICQLGVAYHLCLLECVVSLLNMPIALWCYMAQHPSWNHRYETVGSKGCFASPNLPPGPVTLPIAYIPGPLLERGLNGCTEAWGTVWGLFGRTGDSAPYEV